MVPIEMGTIGALLDYAGRDADPSRYSGDMDTRLAAAANAAWSSGPYSVGLMFLGRTKPGRVVAVYSEVGGFVEDTAGLDDAKTPEQFLAELMAAAVDAGSPGAMYAKVANLSDTAPLNLSLTAEQEALVAEPHQNPPHIGEVEEDGKKDYDLIVVNPIFFAETLSIIFGRLFQLKREIPLVKKITNRRLFQLLAYFRNGVLDISEELEADNQQEARELHQILSSVFPAEMSNVTLENLIQRRDIQQKIEHSEEAEPLRDIKDFYLFMGRERGLSDETFTKVELGSNDLVGLHYGDEVPIRALLFLAPSVGAPDIFEELQMIFNASDSETVVRLQTLDEAAKSKREQSEIVFGHYNSNTRDIVIDPMWLQRGFSDLALTLFHECAHAHLNRLFPLSEPDKRIAFFLNLVTDHKDGLWEELQSTTGLDAQELYNVVVRYVHERQAITVERLYYDWVQSLPTEKTTTCVRANS